MIEYLRTGCWLRGPNCPRHFTRPRKHSGNYQFTSLDCSSFLNMYRRDDGFQHHQSRTSDVCQYWSTEWCPSAYCSGSHEWSVGRHSYSVSSIKFIFAVVVSSSNHRFLGTRPIKLIRVQIQRQPAILALSSRSWLNYTHQNLMHFTPLIFENFDYAWGFSAELSPEGLIGIAGSTLRFVSFALNFFAFTTLMSYMSSVSSKYQNSEPNSSKTRYLCRSLLENSLLTHQIIISI